MCIYILFIISYIELIFSESTGKFQSSLIITVLKADGNSCLDITFNIIKFIYIFSNLGLWYANKVVYL